MKTRYLLIWALLLGGWQARAQDSLRVPDTTRRNLQLEPSFMLADFGERRGHVGLGLNIAGKKSGWYTAIDVRFTSVGYGTASKNYVVASAGKHYQFILGERFFLSAGGNLGLYYHYGGSTYGSKIGVGVIPRLEIGGKMSNLVICAGPYMISHLIYSDLFKWGLEHTFSPYVKLIFDLRRRRWQVEFKEEKVPVSVSPRKSLANEIDSTRRQFGIGGFVFENTTNALYCGILEANFPAKKRGYYNSVIAAGGTFSSMFGYFDFRNESYLLGIGKKYEMVRNHGYYAAGVSIGPCYNNVLTNEYRRQTYGLALVPHIEAGVSLKRIVIAAGLFIPVGAGYFERDYFGDGVSPYMNSGIDAFSNPSPYLKILLK